MKSRLIFAGSIVAAALVALFAGGFQAFDFGRGEASVDPAYANSPAGSQEKFEYLSQQRSNSCSLQPDTVLGYADSKRLQGSCCSPMDMGEYRHQVEDLEQYRAISQIPQDPYDIPASQAKQLLSYREEIQLTKQQQSVYDAAMEMSREKGPCCCECWRYYAFEGMSKHLIQEQGWDSPELANLIELVDGCGGSHAGDDHHGA
ncbi:MAG: hypothetical protein KY393_01285 [Actinobacteria bacterium]|nr:hypothetical protein [Actinomycetota bacterium]